MGLLAAIDRYDPDRRAKFTRFAVPTILGELKRHFRKTGWSAHVPRGAQELAVRVERAAREITSRSGRSPRVDELAAYLEVTIEEVLTGLDAARAHSATSLAAPAGGSESDELLTLGDRLGGEDEGFGVVDLKLSISAAIDRLPYLERRVLMLRIGGDLEQREIAGRLGCSQMHVSRLLRRAHRAPPGAHRSRVRGSSRPDTVLRSRPAHLRVTSSLPARRSPDPSNPRQPDQPPTRISTDP